jgi:hypothetical protein
VNVPAVELTVLVPVRNEQQRLSGSLATIAAQRFDGRFEVLLLHGDSTDATLPELERAAARDPRFRIVDGRGLNLPARLNLGLRLARGELIARVDAHARFAPNYLATGAERLSDGDAASVSGPAIAAGDDGWSRRIALAYRSRLGRGGAQFRHLGASELEVESGYCGLWRRTTLLDLGGWNERFAVSSDVELAARVRAAGGRIVCLRAMAAEHLTRGTLRALARQYLRYGYARAWVAVGHPDTLRRSHVLPPAIAVTVLAAAAGPDPVAHVARRGLGLYALVLLAESARIAGAERTTDAGALPAVFATMHLTWGAGFVFGCLRHGPPWRALRQALSRGRPASS